MKPYNFVSSKAIIAKLQRDLGIQRTDFFIDALEWISEAMDAIGSFAQTESKARITKSNNHRLKLPPGTISVNKLYYTKEKIADGETPTREDFKYVLPYGDPDGHPAFVDEDPDHPTTVDRTEFNESFIISNGYIRTSFDSDWIMISYQGIITDDDGLPLVPDSYEFRQALYWYVVYKLMESGMKHPAGISYLDARNEWKLYCTQARNDANMPTYSEAVRFKDMWVNLLPSKAFEIDEDIDSEGVDADNLVADTFKRYTIAP